MVLDLIAAAFIIAFGIASIYLSVEEGIEDAKMMGVIIIGVLLIIFGSWVLLSRLSLITILIKFSGFMLLALGGFLIFGFPDSTDYQPDGFSKTGIFIGIFVLLFGIALLIL